MKRENRLRSKLVQFGYDHRKFDREMKKVQMSTIEISKMLDNMVPKPQKEDAKEEN